ncbi:hypothetical protein BCV69DRAFT_315317 [Microstroma glucosiphilum]|uniref:Uncharacterized protein n=1 Tax=Pseudomicrostroma glucosiphilum TaxID=1684307 RepID=A0A316TY55_9BASI|nr:hypothetical protein BCV69DRAFT_315317 [Pseudomicrostroma glucosiphilum]PWN17674.1 hypothetical protein BCV69DRAFT_315317 [Pseudomicrostroma glucosiphilum]
MVELNAEDAWIQFNDGTIHLRSYLRSTPRFNPALAVGEQPTLRAKDAKKFWELQPQTSQSGADWRSSWTDVTSQSEPRAALTASGEFDAEAWEDQSISYHEDSEDEGEDATVGATFVPSGSVVLPRPAELRMRSQQQQQQYRTALEDALKRDRCLFRHFRSYLEDTVRPSAGATASSARQQLDMAIANIEAIFRTFKQKIKLPGHSLTILRPFCRPLEAAIQEEHDKSGVADGISDLLDELDRVLDALGAPSLPGETVVSDRLVHRFAHRLSRCRERALQRRLDLEARPETGRRLALPTVHAQAASRVVTRPFGYRGDQPAGTERRDGASSRASSASHGFQLVGSLGCSASEGERQGVESESESVVDHGQ